MGGKTAELVRGVTVQSNGKIVAAGPVEHDPSAAGDDAKDTDVAVVRLDRNGNLDPSFASMGIARFDLGKGAAASPTQYVGDVSWGITRLANDKLLVVGARRAGETTNRDFSVLMLTADGALDEGFADKGILTVDVNGGNENPRQAVVQRDGKIVVSGYTRDAAGVVSPVLFRISPDGALDKKFGKDGIANAKLLPAVAEAYDVAMQGNSFVITGYGRATADEKVDLIAARFTAGGVWDKRFGKDGLVRIDIAGHDDRGRDLVALGDGRLLIAGSGKPSDTDLNGMLVMLKRNGAPDRSFGKDGILLVDLGGPTDSFFAVGLTPDKKKALVTGWKGTDPASGGNDDAVVARVLP